MVIHRVAAWLHHEDIRAAHIFQNLKINLAVAETPQQRLADRNIQVAANTFGQRHMCSARKYFEAVVIHEARAPAILLLFAGKLQLFDGHGGRCGSTNDTRAFDSAEIPVARNCFANEGQVVRNPNSGSARHRWARENSKHRRTATRQRGFWSSSLEQIPRDLITPGMTPENRLLEIVRKAASLRAPA